MNVSLKLRDPTAETHGVHFLCYGTVAGGFLSERWVGVPAPEIATITNRSLIKYRLIIDECGGWEWFQSLLAVLGRVASKHGCDIASVATRVVLDWPRVAGAIVGAVNTTHVASHERVSGVHLD
ncbi:MAG: aldo/keto reductase, partial [Actinobacteria bacterium]|nr:aldo/keto reductase [Actinomycetota bacterium]